VFFAFSRRWRDLARAFHPVGILAFLAIAAPWFAAVMLRESHSASVFWKEIAVATGGGTHGDKDFLFKVFFYPIYLLRDFEPWCVFLLPAIAAACRRLRVCLMDSSGSGEGKFLGFALAWAGGILLQLQLIGNKQPHYFLPAFPALAFLVAWWLESPAPPFRPFPALWRRRAFLGLAAPMLIAAPLLAFLGESLEGSGKGCREFARAAKAAIGSSEVYLLGESMPAMNFYLERVIPVLGGGSGAAGAIDDLLARKQYFHVMVVKTREGGLAPARPDLSGDSRFRRIFEAPPGETPLELYRAER
jgi:4-amino-4-deoxy-L-arabinose transferase-like glycosyltransferase